MPPLMAVDEDEYGIVQMLIEPAPYAPELERGGWVMRDREWGSQIGPAVVEAVVAPDDVEAVVSATTADELLAELEAQQEQEAQERNAQRQVPPAPRRPIRMPAVAAQDAPRRVVMILRDSDDEGEIYY